MSTCSSLVLGMESRDRLEEFIAALGQVIARHDVLRTSVAWEGLPEPVQVVWRRAQLPVTEITLEATGDGPGSAMAALQAAVPARMDLSRAPLLRLTAAAEPGTGRWLALLQTHHMVLDHAGLETVLGEIAALLAGRADALPEPLPFRDFVAQARLGVSREEHQRYFAALLGDVTEPTAPYGLLDIHQPGGSRQAAAAGGCGAGRAVAGAGPGPVGVGGDGRAPGLGAAAGGAGRAGRRGVRHGAAGPDECRGGRGPDPRPVHEHAAGPGAVRRGGVAEALAAMRSQLAELLAHEHAPLVLAQQASGVPAHLPLFTTLLNYRHSRPRGTPGDAPACAGHRASALPRTALTTR